MLKNHMVNPKHIKKYTIPKLYLNGLLTWLKYVQKSCANPITINGFAAWVTIPKASSFPPQAMFPNGLPSVDPNQPLQSQRRLQEALGSAKGPQNGEGFGLEMGGYPNEWCFSCFFMREIWEDHDQLWTISGMQHCAGP